jgi:hypothetical protein
MPKQRKYIPVESAPSPVGFKPPGISNTYKESVEMLSTAIALFAIAILVGIILLTLFLMDGKTPRTLARIHGVIAIIALLLVIISEALYRSVPQVAGMSVIIIAALLGARLFMLGRRNQAFPKWLPAIHAVIAAVGFFLLLISL